MKSARPAPQPSTILLVDDNAARRNARVIMLFTHGYDVHSTSTIAEAQRLCAVDPPDLLLIGVSKVSNKVGSSRPMHRVSGIDEQQRVGFLLDEGEELCSVRFNGELLLPREGPDDILTRVAALMDPS